MKAGRALLLASVVALAACGKRDEFEAPALEDAPVVAAAALADIPVRVPAYGIALKDGRLEVNIEAGDAKLVRAGQEATAYVAPERIPIPCRVTRVLAVASAETGQALAWLTPTRDGRAAANEFVSASIVVAVKRRALSVPKGSVLVRDGRTLVVRVDSGAEGKTAYLPVPVETGDESDSAIEIRSGLKAGDRVVTAGAIGALDPDFKASSGD
jgi:HlyD family secretion protein